MQRNGAIVCTTEVTLMGGESDLVTRLERATASTSWVTASTTRPVLKVTTSGRAPPAEGSMNLGEDSEKKVTFPFKALPPLPPFIRN